MLHTTPESLHTDSRKTSNVERKTYKRGRNKNDHLL